MHIRTAVRRLGGGGGVRRPASGSQQVPPQAGPPEQQQWQLVKVFAWLEVSPESSRQSRQALAALELGAQRRTCS